MTPALIAVITLIVGSLGGCQFEDRDPDAPFTPPLLLSTDTSATILELSGPFTLPLQITGDYPEDEARFVGFTFETRGESVSAQLESASDETRGLIAIYGPRNDAGLWGKALVSASARGEGRVAGIEVTLGEAGRYLVLVGRSVEEDDAPGAFELSVNCGDAACLPVSPPDCPQTTECSLACLNGFERDERGCPVCACVDACANELDCPPGQVCAGGRCEGECQCNLPYEPVCGGDGETYANRCEASCAGVRVIAEEACSQICLPVICEESCPFGYRVDNLGCQSCACRTACEICSQDWEPICTLNNRTFINRCLAECSGERVAYLGACQPQCPALECELTCEAGYAVDPETRCPACACAEVTCSPPEDAQPVCGVDGVTYASACEAGARSVEVSVEETCPGYTCADLSSCPSDMLCVKGEDPTRCVTDLLTGECLGLCVREQSCDDSQPELWCPPGYECVDGGCKASCRCSAAYEPVCGADGDTYDNACIASCQGVEIAKVGRCCEESACNLTRSDCPEGFAYDGNGCPICQCRRSGACVCDPIENPVCAQTPDGPETFINACEAGCAGYVDVAPGACE